MKRQPIGVFDSGLGGLTAVKELIKLLPREDIVYFGDTSRVPYGAKSRDTIIRYAKQDLNFLSTFNIKAALVACGTVSSVAIGNIGSDYDFPVIGVIDSTARAACAATKNKKIGIIGTPATVKSASYVNTIAALDPGCETVSVACPLFVPLVENGHIGKVEGSVADHSLLALRKVDYLNERNDLLPLYRLAGGSEVKEGKSNLSLHRDLAAHTRLRGYDGHVVYAADALRLKYCLDRRLLRRLKNVGDLHALLRTTYDAIGIGGSFEDLKLRCIRARRKKASFPSNFEKNHNLSFNWTDLGTMSVSEETSVAERTLCTD